MNIKNKKNFFEKVANYEYYLIGSFRNEYQELFCLYESNKKCDDIIYITGDEFDWEEENFLESNFIYSKDEIKIINKIFKQHKKSLKLKTTS